MTSAAAHFVQMVRFLMDWLTWPLRRRQPAEVPTAAQLASLLTHIAYEAAALERAAEVYAGTADRFAFEAFLLHARNLREFLWQRWKPRAPYAGSAVVAEHYVPNWMEAGQAVPAIVRDTKSLIDKRLAHLTRERGDAIFSRDLEVDVRPLSTAILSEWSRFLVSATATPWNDQLQEAVVAKRLELGLTRAGAAGRQRHGG